MPVHAYVSVLVCLCVCFCGVVRFLQPFKNKKREKQLIRFSSSVMISLLLEQAVTENVEMQHERAATTKSAMNL